MNIPKEAIEKAIEGGWIVGIEGEMVTLRWEIWALDRTFWQSLGKSLGWPENRKTQYSKLEWEWQALEFVRLILQGEDTSDFWKELGIL